MIPEEKDTIRIEVRRGGGLRPKMITLGGRCLSGSCSRSSSKPREGMARRNPSCCNRLPDPEEGMAMIFFSSAPAFVLITSLHTIFFC